MQSDCGNDVSGGRCPLTDFCGRLLRCVTSSAEGDDERGRWMSDDLNDWLSENPGRDRKTDDRWSNVVTTGHACIARDRFLTNSCIAFDDVTDTRLI